jgi:hypothetical protein
MVLLDATVVNVALPHIQRALGFSGSGLEWVVNAYALAFGGLLLLAGRAGDLLGRRKVFIAGLLLFSAASLAGGFATSEAWLLAARAVQGAGAATIAATALALIATTFPEGPPRNRAMGVYAAMSVAGGAVGLIAGGLLTSYASWRWVLFVNVPIGLAAALLAPRVLPESARQRDRFDLPGAVTAAGGLAALVYGLSSAAASPDGVSHWGDAKVVVSLAASVVLLAAFAVIETRSEHPILQTRLLRDRDRTWLVAPLLGARRDLPAGEGEPADAPPLAHRSPVGRRTTAGAERAQRKGPLLPGLHVPAGAAGHLEGSRAAAIHLHLNRAAAADLHRHLGPPAIQQVGILARFCSGREPGEPSGHRCRQPAGEDPACLQAADPLAVRGRAWRNTTVPGRHGEQAGEGVMNGCFSSHGASPPGFLRNAFPLAWPDSRGAARMGHVPRLSRTTR